MNEYTIKGMKTWKATDGIGTQCWLCRNGVKVAMYTDEGTGGCAMFDWVDRDAPSVAINTTNYKGEPIVMNCSPEEAILKEHVKGMTYFSEFDNKNHPKDEEMFVSELCDAYDTAKKMKAKFKKAIWFRKTNETYAKDEWLVRKVPFTPETKAALVAQYGANLGEILNETYETKVA